MKAYICPQCCDNTLIICTALQNSLVGGRALWLPLVAVAGVILAMQEGLVWWRNATLCPLPLCQNFKSSKVFHGSYYFGHFSPSNIEILCVFWKRQLPLIHQEDYFHYKQTSPSRSGACVALWMLALTTISCVRVGVGSDCQHQHSNSPPESHSDLTGPTFSATSVPAPSKHELMQGDSHQALLDGDPALEATKEGTREGWKFVWRQWEVRGRPPQGKAPGRWKGMKWDAGGQLSRGMESCVTQ